MEDLLACHVAHDLPFHLLRRDHLYDQRVQDVYAGGCPDAGGSSRFDDNDRLLPLSASFWADAFRLRQRSFHRIVCHHFPPDDAPAQGDRTQGLLPVSYTHLTLPTKRIV